VTIRLLLAAALVFAQDGELDGLLRQLGDPDAAVREKASDALAARGTGARDVLLKGRESQDPEIRARATALLMRIDADFRFRCLRDIQRPIKFRVLADAAKDAPQGTSLIDGVTFRFSRRAWGRGNDALGTILETEVELGFEGEIEWSVAEFRGRGAPPVETCDIHSPRLAYLPIPRPGPGCVVVKGLRRWRCEVPVDFKDPVDGQTRRAGPFSVTLAWPCVVVRSDAPLASAVLNRTLTPDDIRCTLKPGINRFGGRASLSVRVACGGVVRISEPRAWCGCVGQPTKFPRAPVERIQELRVSPSGSPKLDDLESISLTLHVPVEEPFEVTSPTLP
jgi:hypothetical protein